MDEPQDKEVARVAHRVAHREIHHGVDRAMKVGISSGAFEQFNRDLIAAGLVPEALVFIMPIAVQLGQWIGRKMLEGIPLDVAIAEIDEIAGAPLETLLDECRTPEEKVNVVMMEATLRALELCCLPGRVVEAATFIVKTAALAATQTLEQHLPSA